MEDSLVFDPSMRKKKKKKGLINLADLEQEGTNEAEEGVGDETEESAAADAGASAGGDGEGVLSLKLPIKKPKKKPVKPLLEDDLETQEKVAPPAETADYTYDELLSRIFDIIRAKNPDLISGDKKKIIVKPPRVMRVGTKKTALANFSDICKSLHRQQHHVLQYLLAELGTTGSIDGNNQLIIKGRFQQKHFESVVRKYIREYLTCHTCKSADTDLLRDARLFFLQCNTCGSRCSVSSIKSGFQAVTGKRKIIKAKEG